MCSAFEEDVNTVYKQQTAFGQLAQFRAGLRQQRDATSQNIPFGKKNSVRCGISKQPTAVAVGARANQIQGLCSSNLMRVDDLGLR